MQHCLLSSGDRWAVSYIQVLINVQPIEAYKRKHRTLSLSLSLRLTHSHMHTSILFLHTHFKRSLFHLYNAQTIFWCIEKHTCASTYTWSPQSISIRRTKHSGVDNTHIIYFDETKVKQKEITSQKKYSIK